MSRRSVVHESVIFDPYAGQRIIVDWLDETGRRQKTPVDIKLHPVATFAAGGRLSITIAQRLVWNSERGSATAEGAGSQTEKAPSQGE